VKSLPTLRRKILRSFLLLVGLYAFLGILLALSVRFASQATPKLLRANYDSISASTRMTEAWTALRYPGYSSKGSAGDWTVQFEEALALELGNTTEPGESDLAVLLKSQWEKAKPNLGKLDPVSFEQIQDTLSKIVRLNEQGMYKLAQDSDRLSQRVLIGTAIYFALSLIVSVFFADQVSQRLSLPLKSIAEALHRRPSVARRLKLPAPSNLEVLILTTELQRLWERLRESENVNIAEIIRQKNKLETLLESVDDGLLVLDAHGRVALCNECFAKLVGLTREQVQGQPWSDLSVSNENYLKLRSALREGMSEALQLELSWNGALSFFSARLRKIPAEGGTGGTLYLLHDITEKKHREKFRAEFIDLLSHELKTPLQSLGTASELLTAKRDDLPEFLRELVETISEDVARIKAVAQEFVQVTQSHSKIMKLKLEMIALNQLLPEWLKPFTLIAKDRGVKLEFRQEGSEVIWAYLDLVKFPWVVSNLVSNAVRFSPQGGMVTILLTDRNGAVEVRVQDQGPGVPESERERIFEPFYQSQVKASSGARGLFGVGLTIAKEVLEAHDGRIEYHSLQPQGSEFRILLPFPPFQHGRQT
jgi:NtrC-family two-component system sensor histidine kinase KinB